MDIQVLNKSFELVRVIDEYESFIWTDRYNTPGDFELFTPVTNELLQCMKRDYYLRLVNTDRLMIIEDIVYQDSDSDAGKTIKVTGRSLESILDRRIVMGKKDVDGKVEDIIFELLEENIMNPEDEDRRITGFDYKRSGSSYISNLTITSQFNCDSLLSIVQTIADTFDIGWKITLDERDWFIFQFYEGKDRSYNQNVNPYVVFSPEYENVIESTYTVVGNSYKTFVLVEGDDSGFSAEDEGEGSVALSSESSPIYVQVGGGSDLLRREFYVSGTSIQKDEEMQLDEYEEKLRQFGVEELSKYSITKKFDGQYETTVMFKYGQDFFMGDNVEVADSFGNQYASKIIEYIWSSNNSSGEESYPTFRSIETSE